MIELPWPPRPLSPNARVHWREKNSIGKKYEEAAHWATLAAGYRDLTHYTGLMLHIVFHPPSARRADIDNMLASIKKGIDGISKATGVDDAKFEITMKRSAPIKGGKVSIAITGVKQTHEQDGPG